MNVVKFLRTPFLKNTSERLLLKILGSCFEVNAEAYSEPNQASEIELLQEYGSSDLKMFL